MITYDNAISEFLKAFPEALEKAQVVNKWWSGDGCEELPYVFFGNVANYITIDALKTNNNPELLSRLFKFFEDMSKSSEDKVIDLLKWGTLEVIGDDKKILKHARSLMGEKTLALSHDTERYWGRE